jgi:hypothetical protein
MKKLDYLRYGSAVTIVATLLLGALPATAHPPPPAGVNSLPRCQPPPKGNPKLESSLSELIAAYQEEGMFQATSFARRRGLALQRDQVRVVLVAENENTAWANQAVELAGGQAETSYRNLVRALVPISALEGLAQTSGIRFVRPPRPPITLALSEGVSVTRADDWHSANYTGEGVRVAIVDVGFIDYDTLLGTDLPSTVETWYGTPGGDVDGGSDHGTACAEIVYDMTPDAEMYLARVDDPIDWANAVDWLIGEGVDIISFSAGWPVGGPGDGTGYFCDAVNDARDDGVLWVNSAGNYATHHWQGQWKNPDDDDWHNFAGTDETNNISASAGRLIVVGLRWDDTWGVSGNDYDLYLFDSDIEVVAASINVQDGDDDPVEFLVYSVTESGVYHIAINEWDSSRAAELELFSYHQDFQYQTAGTSLTVPADCEDALAVGATHWDDDTLEPFSSQGPTNDGRTKPDLTAPDAVSTETYGPSDGNPYPDGTGFFGTSASAPHVSGAAALVLEANPTYQPDDIQSFLEGRALDLGPQGKDNQYGAGRLGLGLPLMEAPRVDSITPDSETNDGVVHITNLAGANFQTGATVRLTRVGEPDINATNVVVVNAAQITCDFDLTGAAVGLWDVVVTNPDDRSGTLPGGFTVEAAPPRVDSITPISGTNDGVVHITNLAGANFQAGATVELTRVGEPDISATNVVVVNAAQITCDLDPTDAAIGAWDVVVTNPDDQSGTLPGGFTVEQQGPEEYIVYLPLALRRWPPILDTPVLNPISNPDSDGNYTVDWNAIDLAQTYTLQEDNNAAFSSPTTVYSGPNTSKSITGRDVGTYYYRVRASNEFGSSAWSGVRSIVVIIPPTGPEPGHYTGTPSVSFDVTEDQQVCNFGMTIPFAGGSCRIRALSCTEIVDNGVTFVESHPLFGVVMWITGTFDSRTHVSGDYSVSMCGNELISPPSRGTWEANK